MKVPTNLAVLVLPFAVLACAQAEPQVDSQLAEGLRDGQRQACRAAVADAVGLTASDISETFASVTPAGTAMYHVSSTAGTYRCEVDNAFQVVSLSPTTTG